MAKHNESLPLIIVASDFKFKQFDYDRFEIEYIKQYSNLVIWDVSLLSSKSYHKSISSGSYKGNDLKVISSYKQLLSEIIFIKKSYKKKDVCVMNFVTPGSLASLIFLISVKKLSVNSIKYYNSGVPNILGTNDNISVGYLIKALKRRFYLLISKIFNIFPTHCIYAGDYWKHKYENVVKARGAKWLNGNTWDYSNILLKNVNKSNQHPHLQKKAVLLDGAGPMFNSDDVLIGKKTYITSKVWYPSLVLFLDKVEKVSNTRIDIAAHPKSSHKPNPSYFGHRNVSYGKTLEMVRDSDFVITRQSTAISFAVIFKKPVIFIYSNQLKKDKIFMVTMNKMSELLGTTPINIDGDLEGFIDAFKVNEYRYEAYKKNYLTSNNCNKANAHILLEKILLIKT